MTPAEFRNWRETMGLSQTQAAKALGLSVRVIKYYDNGTRSPAQGSVPVIIPHTVHLACVALQMADAFKRDGSEGLVSCFLGVVVNV